MPRFPFKQPVKVLSIIAGVLLVVCLWLVWSYTGLKTRTEFAQEQIQIFNAASSRAMASTPAAAAASLHYLVNYYPSGTKQEAGSALDQIVEQQRQRAIQEIIAVLRVRTHDDLGPQPEPWIKKYGKTPAKK